MSNSSYHVPVLLNETLEFLDLHVGETVVDGTLGGGGHSEAISEQIGPEGKLIGIDQDPEAIEESKKRLENFKNVIFINDNFANLRTILKNLNIEKVGGILLDLGVSTHQLETPERGFSFGERGENAFLDMRMSPSLPVRAYDIVNFYSEKRLREVFFKLGEEPFGGKIAQEIAVQRQKKLIETAGELLEIIKKSLPPNYRFSRTSSHWASKVFRGLRMEVNQELTALELVLPQAVESLKIDGRLVILTFHSLEDRMVKQKFKEWEDDGLVKVLTPKPISASYEEVEKNEKARSAKLRAVRKII